MHIEDRIDRLEKALLNLYEFMQSSDWYELESVKNSEYGSSKMPIAEFEEAIREIEQEHTPPSPPKEEKKKEVKLFSWVNEKKEGQTDRITFKKPPVFDLTGVRSMCQQDESEPPFASENEANK